MTAEFAKRHAATQHLLRFFDPRHLRPELRGIVLESQGLAHEMARELPDSPELTAGLRKLLEAKDCFVRCAVEVLDEVNFPEAPRNG